MEKGLYLGVLIIIIFLISIQNTEALTLRHVWNQTLDNQTSTGWYSCVVDNNDYSIHAGDVNNADGVLAKYDKNGALQWNLSSIPDYFRDVFVDSNNNIYTAGKSDALNPSITKYNSTGSQIWNASLTNGTSGQWQGVTVDTNDDVIAIGWDTTGVWNYAWVAKYTSTGTQLWNASFAPFAEAQGYKVATDSNNNVYAAMTAGGALVDAVFWILKYNSTGTQLWNWSYEGAGAAFVYPTDVQVDSDDDILLSVYDTNAGFENFQYLFKFNSTGGQIWNRTYTDAASGDVYPEEIAIDSENNIISLITIDNGDKVLLTKYDTDGYMMYNVTIKDAIQDDLPGVGIESDNSIILSGDGKYNSTHFNRFVFKFNDGTPKWSNFYKAGKTTYLYNESDLDSVSDLILDSKYSLIEWNQAVNASHANMTGYVSMGEGYVSLNSLYLDSTFNASANVSINVSNCDDWIIYHSTSHVTSLIELKNTGTIVGRKSTGCTEYCSNPVCVNGQLNYTVSSFSSTGAESVVVVAQSYGGGGGVSSKSYSSSYYSTTTQTEELPEECKESWLCGEWSSCTNGKQTRTCEDWNKCGTTETKPATEKQCTAQSETRTKEISEKQKQTTDTQLLLSSSTEIETAHSKITTFQMGIGAIVILMGIIIYLFYQNKK